METLQLDLKDFFASKVLEGIYSNNQVLKDMMMDRAGSTRDKSKDSHEDYIAQQCYLMAEAMIKERNFLINSNK
jgi:hypothetical protein